jgi:chemotaxis response regulator CheB
MAENPDSVKTGKTPGGRTRKAGHPSAKTDVRRGGSQPRTTNGKPPAIKAAADGGRPQKTDAELFPIVGIGASAGGLEALTELLRAMPDDPGIAVVYIQHMAPTHESMLPDHERELRNPLEAWTGHRDQRGIAVVREGR